MIPIAFRLLVASVRASFRRTACLRSSAALSFLCLGLPVHAAESASSMPVVDGKWRHFQSPHFELYSRNGDRESRELLHNLEILRAVFLERLNVEPRRTLDITIYYFRSRPEFEAYAPEAVRQNESSAGFYLANKDRALISMAPAHDSQQAQQTIFHEYVHHLFRIVEQNPPLWYNEGTAEVLSGMKVERKHVLIGAPLEDNALYLREQRLIPIEDLFAADYNSALYTKESKAGVFYAQAWALLHFWHFSDGRILKGAADRFLKVAARSDAPSPGELRKHFQACFGYDYPEMQSRLQDYIRSGSFRMGQHPLPALPPSSSYAGRPAPIDEIHVRLAELAVRVNRSPEGKLALLNAITTRTGDPRPLETLGTEALLGNDVRAATERWEQALAAGSTNPAIVRELAVMEGEQWFSHFDPAFRLPAEIAARLRERLLRSIELEPKQAAAYDLLIWVEAFSERANAANINRVIAQLPSMPDRKHALIGMSLVLMRAAKPKEAAATLDYLTTVQLNASDARAVAVLRDELYRAFPEAGAGRNSGASAPQVIAPAPSSPDLKTPSVALPDDL